MWTINVIVGFNVNTNINLFYLLNFFSTFEFLGMLNALRIVVFAQNNVA